jgi:hypothetical protein
MMRAWPFGANEAQIFAILALRQFIDNAFELRLIDKLHPKGNFFETGDLESLSMFDGRDVIPRFQQAGLRSRVEPRHAAAQRFYMQFVPLEINQIQIGDLQLAAR